MEGWIKIDRRIKEWEWYDDSFMVHLFLHILVSANHEDSEWHGIEIKRGQLVTGRNKLSAETGISERTIRTCLKKLCNTGEINIKTTNKYSVISICKYDTYQSDLILCDQQLTNNRPTTDQQVTTNKNEKNDKNNRKETSPKGESKKRVSLTAINDRLIDEKNKFQEELRPYVEIYGRDMMNDFFSYWTEPNRSQTRMRFQLERTWDTKRRVENWARRDRQKQTSNEKYNRPTKEQRDAEIADLMARKLSAIGSH